MNPFSLQGKVALVSGANTGLGQAMAIALAEAGADVAAVGRTDPADTASAVQAAGRRFHWVEASLDTTAPIPAIIDTVERELGGIDILVNNAGTIRRNDALDFSEDDWDAIMAVHLKGHYACTAPFARYIREQDRRGCRILNFSSVSGLFGNFGQSNYGAAKAGIAGFSRVLALELAKHERTVNTISPGAATRLTIPLMEGRGDAAAEDDWTRGPGQIAPASFIETAITSPTGTRPIITMQPAISSAVASKLLARKARKAAEAMKKARIENMVACIGTSMLL